MRSFLGKLVVVFLAVGVAGHSQTQPQVATVVVNGQPGQAFVIPANGRTFVDIENLMHIVNGSVSYQGNQIVLSVPAGGSSGSTNSSTGSSTALSPTFMKAAIEEMAIMREWGTSLANAIRNLQGKEVKP